MNFCCYVIELVVADKTLLNNFLQSEDVQSDKVLIQASSEESKLTVVEDDDFLVPLVSRRTSKRLRRSSIQLFRKSIDATLDCDFIDEKQSGVDVCGKNSDDARDCQHTKLCDSNANLSYALISDQPDTLTGSASTTQLKQVPRVRKRKNLSHRKCDGQSDEVGVENVSIPSTTLTVNPELATVSDVLPEQNVDASSQLAGNSSF